MGYVGKTKQRRKKPYPNSILDRKALLEALENAGLEIKSIHVDAFYQALHRQHYPSSLSKFVETYYQNERKEYGYDEDADADEGKENNKQKGPQPQRPLKNAITNRKNRNRVQLPKVFLEFLQKTPDLVACTSTVQKKLTSKDQSTTKLIVQLHDGKVVESVLMRYEKKGSGRASLCVSSQCGCAMGCTFCATGTMGLSGNLTTGEILEQLVHADAVLADEYQSNKVDKSKKLDLVRNVVFMGMGEPLDNYNNVIGACRAMMDRKRWNLAHGRVTVSTVGLVSQIRKLTKDLPEVSLALSLHAPNQKMRTAIVPTATRFPIEQLIDALDNHMMAYLKKRNGEKYTEEERIKESTRRRAMIEYVMLEGDTSTIECAHQLGRLCENRHLVVNLIPYNATDVKDKLQCPSNERMQQFRDVVASYGTFCTIRRTMGADIASACGQLVKKEEGDNEKEGAERQQQQRQNDSAVDIEDVVRDNDTNNRRRSNNKTNIISKGQQQQQQKEMTSLSLVSNSNDDTNDDDDDDNDDDDNKEKESKNDTLLFSTSSVSDDTLEYCTNALTIATSISATCFVLSSISFLLLSSSSQKQKR